MTPIYKIPKFNFTGESLRFESVTVATETRRIRATWTPELAQDLHAFHGIDVEAELIALLNQEITREIDREIINTITQDLVTVQPLDLPRGELLYFDFQMTINEIKEPKVYSDGSWSLGNTFESSIGFKSEIRPFKFI